MTSSPPSSHLAMAVPPESPALPDGNWREGLRSLWHLSRHLTARADDNHAAPPPPPLLAPASPPDSGEVRARVRFLAYHRIKPHVPPLVRAPVNSFEFHRCGGLPSQSEFFVISKHFTATPRIPPASAALKSRSSDRWPGLGPGISRPAYGTVCAPFKPNESG